MQLMEKDLKKLKFAIIAIFSVVVIEITSGLAVGSLAIISDGVHTLTDLIIVVILLTTTKSSLKPPDEDHMYGHEKIEPIGALICAMILLGIAASLILKAVQGLIYGEILINKELESVGFFALTYALFIGILRATILRSGTSIAIKAGFFDSLADISSTIVAIIGFGLATFGFPTSDALASLLLSLAICFLGVRLMRTSIMELSDYISKEVVEMVRKEITSIVDPSSLMRLRVRKAGLKTFVEAVIKTPDYMRLVEAHLLASKIEERLKNTLKITEVMIHLEPQEVSTLKIVEELAEKMENIKGVHNVNVTYVNGYLYITLHAYVDPKLSVVEAHNLAEKVESELIKKLENVKHISVHIEPFIYKIERGSIVSDEKIQDVIYKIAEGFNDILTLKRIVTYVVDGKRYINIDCCFKNEIPIEETHRIVSKIESMIKKRFLEVIINTHIEPKSN
ncbi:MAG: cation-efflux pump [Candidatus Methanomethyliaceae archaeon]|nr:cation-efflux pump [Candidatus Methanomethyliaceae archaeon]MDW7971208.1 cation diffusion facilitator family transporter [Nitrososphaerota archaeon]